MAPKTLNTQVVIRGGGVAAYCCAHLLGQANVPVIFEGDERKGLPAILIGDATRALIEDVFARKDIFDGLPRIDKRIVAWGVDAQDLSVPHSAVVVSERELLERLRRTSSSESPEIGRAESQWIIYAGRQFPPGADKHAFGTRTASAVRVSLRTTADLFACCIESLEGGWLFLMPGLSGKGWLLSVGSPADALLKLSRVVAAQLDLDSADFDGVRLEFPAYPRIIAPLADAAWLACGSAAMAFDPLCGDGTGNAIREAILACAVIRASLLVSSEDSPLEDLISHYRRRLTAGFARHLEQCLPFYDAGHTGPWWSAEREQIRTGIQWCRAQLAGGGPFQYRLSNFDLERITL
jgi:hypothetical protein